MSEQNIGIINEHEGAPKADTMSADHTGYMPTDEEKAAIKLVDKLREKAKKERKKHDEKWLDYYRMFRGKQWKETRPAYRHSEVVNMIFQMIQSDVPTQLDSKPKFEFIAQNPADFEFAKYLNQACQSDWERKNWTYKLTEIVYDSRFYGTGIGSMEYDPKGDFGNGEIIMDSKDVFHCYPDPYALDVNERSNYFVLAEPVPIDVVKREYPELADFIKGDIEDLTNGDRTDLNQVRYKSPVDTKTILEGTSAFDLKNGDRILKTTVYMKSDETTEEESDGQPDQTTGIAGKVYTKKLKYPNGRKICVAGGVLLSNGPIPFDDGMFPFAKYNTYLDPHSFWGIGDVEQLESPQKTFNKLISFALDTLTLMGNPVWVVDNTSGIDTDNLFNRPGLVIEKEPNSVVTRVEGVQLQPYVLGMIDKFKGWFDDVGGNNDVSRGVTANEVTAASAITALQDSAKTRVRQKSRNLDAFLQNLGQMYVSRLMQFSAVPKMYRLTDDQGVSKYFKMSVSQDESGKKIATVQHFDKTEGGQYATAEARQYQIEGEFDVRVNTGSSLPFAKTEKIHLAFNLLKAGAIDQEELLNAVDYPNKEAVWARTQERQQAVAAQQGGQPR